MQAKLLAIGLAATLGGGAYLATTSQTGDYYDLSKREVASRLATASFPGSVNEQMSSGGTMVPRVYRRGQSEVVWKFTAAHRPLASFTASLEPEGEGTRVSVRFDMADNDIGEAALQDIGEGREFLVGVLETAMEEHVAATLEGRKFDDREFARDIAGFVFSNPKAAKKYIRRMRQIEANPDRLAIKDKLQETIEVEAAWNASEPMLDTTGFDPTPPKGGW